MFSDMGSPVRFKLSKLSGQRNVFGGVMNHVMKRIILVYLEDSTHGLTSFRPLFFSDRLDVKIRAVESASLKVGKSLKIGNNRKKNRIKLDKIGFDLNSDSTALIRFQTKNKPVNTEQ